ncbi:MAG: hypothetical protein GEU99_22580 [Luteitalea sp.]|nr:hypothetical protein [Luteitalea sp.]
MKNKATAITLAVLGLGLLLAPSATNAHGNHRVSTSPMMEFMNSGRVPGPDDVSRLLRSNDWVDVAINTSGLDPSTPYTLWGVIFNRREYCATSPCGEGDLPVSPGHDPRVRASVVYVTGGFSGADGTMRLEARLHRAKNGVKPTDTLFGAGLLDGGPTEIHFVLRGHGQEAAEPLLAIGSYNAGCTDANPCSDQQATVHVAR